MDCKEKITFDELIEGLLELFKAVRKVLTLTV